LENLEVHSERPGAFIRVATSGAAVGGRAAASLVSIDPAAAIDYIQSMPGRAAKCV